MPLIGHIYYKEKMNIIIIIIIYTDSVCLLVQVKMTIIINVMILSPLNNFKYCLHQLILNQTGKGNYWTTL